MIGSVAVVDSYCPIVCLTEGRVRFGRSVMICPVRASVDTHAKVTRVPLTAT
jgi:hypothetical protein